ncbi:MAG: DDE-type integrase/transposase/recombinase [Candidatus Bathyarchaeia archaeon]
MLLHLKRKYEFKLYLGDVWEIDETYLSVKGKRLPLILVRDLKTGFIIVGKLRESVTAKAIKEVLTMARTLAFKSPKELRCDGLQSYARPVRVVFKGKTKLSVHKREGEMGRNEAIEGTIRALKDRLKRMLGLHSFKVSPIIVEGTILDFNFVRKSEALGSKTPAEVALKRRPIIDQDEGWLFLLKLAKIYERIQCCKNYRKRRRNYLESDEHQASLDSFID